MEDAHDAKAQGFAHRLVEFADLDACVKFFSERSIDFDRANDMGWSVLMSVCASGTVQCPVVDSDTNSLQWCCVLLGCNCRP
jgi:hypothetical protein